MTDTKETEDELSIEEILDSIRQIITEDDDDESTDTDATPDDVAAASGSSDSAAEDAGQSPINADDLDALFAEDDDDGEDVTAPAAAVIEPNDTEDILELTQHAPLEKAKESPPEEAFDIDMVDTDGDEAEVDTNDSDNTPDITEESLDDAPAEDDTIEDVAEDPVVEDVSEPPAAEPEQKAVEETPEPAPAPVQDVTPQGSEGDALLTTAAENAAVSAMSALVRRTAVEHNGVTIEDIVRAELKPLLKVWLDKHLPTVIERLVSEELERVSKRVLED